MLKTPFRSHSIIDALNCIHSKGYVHCDIKTDNILVFKKSYLIDFGTVKSIAHPFATKYEEHYDHIIPEVFKGNPGNSASESRFKNYIQLWLLENLFMQDLYFQNLKLWLT